MELQQLLSGVDLPSFMFSGNIPSLQQECSWECEVFEDMGLCESKNICKANTSPSQHGVRMVNQHPPHCDMPWPLHSSSCPSCWAQGHLSQLPAPENIWSSRKPGLVLHIAYGCVSWEQNYGSMFPPGCSGVPCLDPFSLLMKKSLTFFIPLLH